MSEPMEATEVRITDRAVMTLRRPTMHEVAPGWYVSYEGNDGREIVVPHLHVAAAMLLAGELYQVVLDTTQQALAAADIHGNWDGAYPAPEDVPHGAKALAVELTAAWRLLAHETGREAQPVAAADFEWFIDREAIRHARSALVLVHSHNGDAAHTRTLALVLADLLDPETPHDRASVDGDVARVGLLADSTGAVHAEIAELEPGPGGERLSAEQSWDDAGPEDIADGLAQTLHEVYGEAADADLLIAGRFHRVRADQSRHGDRRVPVRLRRLPATGRIPGERARRHCPPPGRPAAERQEQRARVIGAEGRRADPGRSGLREPVRDSRRATRMAGARRRSRLVRRCGGTRGDASTSPGSWSRRRSAPNRT